MTSSSLQPKQTTDENQAIQGSDPTRALVLRGHSFLPLSMGSQMSLMDRMLFGFSSFCNRAPLSMEQISRALPPSFGRMFQNVSNVFNQIMHMEEGEELLSQVQGQMELKFHEMITQRRQLYLLAGVECEDELQKKKEHINDCQNQAASLYFAKGETRELKRRMDVSLLQLSTHSSKSNLSVINTYWDLVSDQADPFAFHDETESRFVFLFLENLMETANAPIEASNDTEKKVPHKKIELLKLLIKTAENKLYETLQALLAERNTASSEIEATRIDYLILKGRLIAPTLMQNFIREQGLAFLEPIEKETRTTWVRFAIKQQARNVPYYKEDIERTELKIAELEKALAVKKASNDNCRFEETQIPIQQEFLKSMQKLLAETESRDLYAYACRFASEDPRRLKKQIPQLTPYDHLVLELYPILSSSREERDWQMDLTQDLVARHMETLKQKDQEFMIHLQSRLDRIQELPVDKSS